MDLLESTGMLHLSYISSVTSEIYFRFTPRKVIIHQECWGYNEEQKMATDVAFNFLRIVVNWNARNQESLRLPLSSVDYFLSMFYLERSHSLMSLVFPSACSMFSL